MQVGATERVPMIGEDYKRDLRARKKGGEKM